MVMLCTVAPAELGLRRDCNSSRLAALFSFFLFVRSLFADRPQTLSDMSTPSQLHASILQYIAQLQAAGNSADNGVTDAEPLEIAAQCIVEATGADAKAAKVRDQKTQ